MINRNEIKAGSGAPASASTTRIIAKFKTPQEIEERNAFIAGAEAARKDSIDIWKSSDLKKLTLEALLDRLERVDNQASLLRWKIFSAIRAHFLSDKLYGQYLAELRENPNYAGLIGTQQDAHRSACAGRFCEKHGINNLNDAGILKSTVYALSRPANADISDSIYKQIKKKSLPLNEVERLIAQAKAITGEVVPEVQVIDYDNIGNVQEPGEKVRHLRRAIQLENGKIPGLMVEQQCDALTDMMANAFADAEAVTKVDYEAPEEDFEEEVEAVHIHIERAGVEESVLHNATDDDLLLELASRRAVGLTPEQMANEILLLSERFGLSSIKLIPIMQLCTRHLQSSSYFRKTGGAA
jgi:hypothetical protein